MQFDLTSYHARFLQKTFGAIQGEDFTLNYAGEIVAWNSAMGEKPDTKQLEQGMLQLVKDDLIAAMNNLAGEVRASYLSDGLYVVEEYQLAEQQALQFKSQGFSGEIPPCVRDYADLFPEQDYEGVATAILFEADQLRRLLEAVRKIRLTCTVGVRAAPDIETAIGVYDGCERVMSTLKRAR